MAEEIKEFIKVSNCPCVSFVHVKPHMQFCMFVGRWMTFTSGSRAIYTPAWARARIEFTCKILFQFFFSRLMFSFHVVCLSYKFIIIKFDMFEAFFLV